LEGDYIIEVSSPGVDRLLTRRKEFLKAIRRNLRVLLKSPMEAEFGSKEKQEFSGELLEANEENIHLNTKEGILIIPLSNIDKAKQVIK
jgi:ribosome maturation factor RimP